MTRKFASRLLATAIALSPIPLVATTLPAAAQANISISFGYFYDRLAPYGQWYHHARWGDVWRPREANFRPYHRGHWDYTDRYGWVWTSAYDWDEIPSHYGRWVYDPSDGWLWVPGYVWAPAWVVWRSGGGYVGWFPMPPDDAFLAGDEVYRTNWDNWDSGYGYADWYGASYGPNWLISIGVFVNESHFADRDFSRYVAPPAQVATFVNNTRNVTNYVTQNNYIVNRSVDPAQISRASGRQIRPVPASDVVKTNVPIVPVNVGREVQQQERPRHGGDPKAPPQAKVVALPPSAAHANSGPAQGGNAQLGNNNQPGGRANRNAREAAQPSIAPENPNAGNAPREQNQRAQRAEGRNAPANQQPNLPPPQQAQRNGNSRAAQRGQTPNQAAAPPAPPAVTENRNGQRGGRFNGAPNEAPNAPPPRAQANRERPQPPPEAIRPQRAPQAAPPPARAEAPPPQPEQRQANRGRQGPPPEANRPQRAPEAAPPAARAEAPPPQQAQQAQQEARQANNARGQEKKKKE